MRTSSCLLAAALLAVAAGPSAFAQDAPTETSSMRFVNALAQRGWFDLATAVIDDISKDSATPKAVKDQLPFMRANLQIQEGMASQDPAVRKQKVDDASKFFDDFAKKNPDSPMAAEARFRIGEIFMQAGDAALGRLRAEGSNEDTRKADREEADDRYKRAAAYFIDLKNHFATIDVVTDDEGNVTPASQAAIDQLAQSTFLEAKAYWRHAQLYEPGKERDDLMKKAVDGFTKCNFDFSDELVGFEAAINLGLAQKDCGKLDEAVQAFDAAANLVEVVGWKKGQPWDPSVQDIVSRALFLKTQLLNEKGSFQPALDASKVFLDDFPDMLAHNEQLAMALKLEEAVARNGTGDQKAALKICETVENTDKNGPIGAMARNTVAKILGRGGATVELSPDKALSAADTLISNGKVYQGMARLRQLIAECEVGNDEAKALVPQIWYKIARLYFEQDRYDEAAACFDYVAKYFPTNPLAPTSIFLSANCAGRVNGALPNQFDKDRSVANLQVLSSKYPEHPAAKSAAFLLGNEKLGARDYEGAAAEYAKVTEAAGEFYDAALYQLAVVWMMAARNRAAKKENPPAQEDFQKSLAAFAHSVEWAGQAATRGVDAASDRAKNLHKLASDAWLRIAEIRLHPLVLDAAKSLEAAKAAEKVLTDSGQADGVGEARYYIVQAQLAANNLDASEAALTDLVAVAPDAKRTADAERDVAVAIDAKAQELKKAGNATATSALLARAADHYVRWLQVADKAGQPVTVVAAGRAGDRIFQIALALNNLPESTFSFTEIPNTPLPAPDRFRQALIAYDMAAPAEPAPGAAPVAAPPAPPPAAPAAPPKPGEVNNEPWLILVKCGQCHGFLREYGDCARLIHRAVELEHLLVEGGRLAVAVAQSKPSLLFAYADEGRAFREASNAGKDKTLLEQATTVFQRLVGAAQQNTELWWRCKYEFLYCLFLKGDYNSATVGLGSLRRTNPTFDGGRYQPQFEALSTELDKKKP